MMSHLDLIKHTLSSVWILNVKNLWDLPNGIGLFLSSLGDVVHDKDLYHILYTSKINGWVCVSFNRQVKQQWCLPIKWSLNVARTNLTPITGLKWPGSRTKTWVKVAAWLTTSWLWTWPFPSPTHSNHLDYIGQLTCKTSQLHTSSLSLHPISPYIIHWPKFHYFLNCTHFYKNATIKVVFILVV